ncbi:MAG TPA: bifunctional DNA primase/polymerase [Chromatiaceae bacterium]|nr:bifunctional DNA primase/polymerase [Chromatiaceae bacterium]
MGSTAVSRGASNTKVLREHIKTYLSRGLSVIPLKFKGKEPLVSWKEFQGRIPSTRDVDEWFKKFKSFNVAIVTGTVSGNLVVIDFDSKGKAKEFYEKIKGLKDELLRFALGNTWWVETGKGIHIYLRINCEREEFKELFRTKPKLVEGVDIKAEGGYVVAPPSIHPSGKQYRFIQGSPEEEIQFISVEEWGDVLKLLGYVEKPKVGVKAEKELSEGEVLEIVNMLREAYQPGQRDLIIFFLTGWLRKAGVKYEVSKKIVELLAEGDEEKDRRLYVLDRTYGLKGKPPSPEEQKGKTGLQEILEKTFGEERALEVIRRIEEILGTSSPFRDSIIELLDYEKQFYAIANLRKLITARAKKKENKLVYKERVIVASPTKVVVYRNPLGGVSKYEVVFEGKTLSKPLKIGPCTLHDIIDRLRVEGLVYHRKLVEDVLSAVMQAYIRKGRAEVKEEIEAKGFYLASEKVVSVRWEPKNVSNEELREALELLNELAEKWFGHVKERFATIIKWGLVSPFSYCYKQLGRWVPWLYLYGASYTGKTTLGEIILNMWGLGSDHRKSGSSIDTVPRLGYVLSSSTFPILVNEPGSAVLKEDVVEVMKSAIESTITRGKFVRGTYMEIPSLATLIMTSNKAVPQDDALLRRVVVLRFTFGERINPAKASKFEKEVKPKLRSLKAIGFWVARKIVSEPKLLENNWGDLAEKLLVEMFTAVGMEVPKWVKLSYEVEENVYEDIREAIRSYLLKRINEEYTRFVGRVVVEAGERTEVYQRSEVDFEERVRIVLENKLLPWAFLHNKHVYFSAGLIRELRSVVGDVGGLKSVSELLGWDYKVFKIKGKLLRGMRTSFKSLIKFLK